MVFRAKTPLRLGFGGGGTDIAAYADKYGGAVLNATVNLYTYCYIEPLSNGKTIFNSIDLNKKEEYPTLPRYEILPGDYQLQLVKGVYNRVVKDYCNGKPLSIRVSTDADVPPGSGLGTSSTLVVCILKCFAELLSLPLSEYDIAHLAYSIEREDLRLHGGKQDQYAAVFGGFNFMEFSKNDQVVVNPLRIHSWIKNEIQSSLVLYYIGKSHDSSKVIDDQMKSVHNNISDNLLAMHEIKKLSYKMKESLLKGEIREFELLFNEAWEQKKKTSPSISNSNLDQIYQFAMSSGAISGKISGAGGGGCFFFFVDPTEKKRLSRLLVSKFGGSVFDVEFTEKGAVGWHL
jgi:D-glycero-alpha-D-manno-heptose-7-phosphate kinase